MIRIPHIFIPKLIVNPLRQTVSRLVIAHPSSVQFVQYEPVTSSLVIRYVSGQEITIHDKENPEVTKKMFDKIVFQFKDVASQ